MIPSLSPFRSCSCSCSAFSSSQALRRGQQQAALRIEVSSQFATVVVLHEPLLAFVARVALLHDQLVLGLVDGQALARGAVAQLLCVLAICPELQKREKDTVKEESKEGGGSVGGGLPGCPWSRDS